MRKRIVAGNWKMNMDYEDSKSLFESVNKLPIQGSENNEVIVFPPFCYLSEFAKEVGSVKLGAQNVSERENGAVTGEVSATMLSSLNLDYVLVGHSERRLYFNEEDALLFQKAKAALASGIKVMFCCGESLEERNSNRQFDVVRSQLMETVLRLTKEEFEKVTIAYEPVWAIGTGKTATTEQAQEMHQFIRGLITEKFDANTANNSSILYGGSCKPENAAELFAQEDIDGGLIGGASLKSEDFGQIINAING